jgi:hypothetical protein
LLHDLTSREVSPLIQQGGVTTTFKARSLL